MGCWHETRVWKTTICLLEIYEIDTSIQRDGPTGPSKKGCEFFTWSRLCFLSVSEEVLGEAYCNRGRNTEGPQAIFYLSFWAKLECQALFNTFLKHGTSRYIWWLSPHSLRTKTPTMCVQIAQKSQLPTNLFVQILVFTSLKTKYLLCVK